MAEQTELIQIRYLADGLPELAFIGGKSDWIDLYVAENVHLHAGEYRLIRLGVAIALPSGYEALLAPRSSTFQNYGILQANSIGIIDNSYRGDTDEWKFPAYATRDTDIAKGARICQFRILRSQPPVEFVRVEHLTDPDRGGYGTTGK